MNKVKYEHKEFIYNSKDESDIFGVYKYVQMVLHLRRYENNRFMDNLNSLQTFQNMTNEGAFVGADIWSSKGNIPYQVVNMLIKQYNLEIRRREVK